MSTKPEALPIVAWLMEPNEHSHPNLKRDVVFDRPVDRPDWMLTPLTDHTTATARISELEAEVERLRADAERYRLLRRVQRWSVINGIGDNLRAESLDAAIDQARQAQKGGA